MIVPQFWAEARVRVRTKQRQITVRRFGWSDVSQEGAQAMADARAKEAFDRVAAGEPLKRREFKHGYDGAEGLPIREKIIARHGETVITRNVYGALCLNTPNVLFADVDLPSGPGDEFGICAGVAVVAAVAGGICYWLHTWIGVMTAAIIAVLAMSVVLRGSLWYLRGGSRGAEQRARLRVERFVENNPAWALRLYRTPAGLRLLATQRLFDPLEPEVADFFAAIGADPIYVKMCRRQRCFRARVSPKPWRVGVDRHYPHSRPEDPSRDELRAAWVRKYDKLAEEFASCRFIDAIGSFATNPDVAPVCTLHDDLCRATSDLPIA